MKCSMILIIFITEQMTIEGLVLVIRTFYKYNGSLTATVRELRVRLGYNVVPNESSVRRLVKKFEITGFVLNLKKTRGRVLFGLIKTLLSCIIVC